METTKNDLPKKVKKFFYELSDYLDTKLLYYGSIQRSDYVPGGRAVHARIFHTCGRRFSLALPVGNSQSAVEALGSSDVRRFLARLTKMITSVTRHLEEIVCDASKPS